MALDGGNLEQRATEVLGDRFGFASFRAGQDELVAAILSGRDAMGVMPTGAGKSLCYQVPSLMFSAEGSKTMPT